MFRTCARTRARLVVPGGLAIAEVGSGVAAGSLSKRTLGRREGRYTKPRALRVWPRWCDRP
eukprot:scaffold3171_cov380-Prasinococcus_capsulatus_cf.AAC.9